MTVIPEGQLTGGATSPQYRTLQHGFRVTFASRCIKIEIVSYMVKIQSNEVNKSAADDDDEM